MRFLILCHEFLPDDGGGAQGAGHLAKEIARRHRVDVITRKYPGVKWREIDANLTIHRIPVWGTKPHGYASVLSIACYSLFAMLLSIALLMRRRYDAVNGHFGVPAGAIAVIVSWLFRVPNVVTLIGAEIYDPPRSDEILRFPLAKRVIGWTIRKADQVVVLSRAMLIRIRQDFGIDRECSVVPFGIPKVFGPRKPEVRPCRNGRLKLLCVATLVSRKRHEDLLKCLKQLEDNIHLSIVGDGPERPRLRELEEELGLNGKVTFRGALYGEAKWQAYREADAFVLVSEHECQGLVYVEAMQAGLPVVAGDRGGQLDFIRHERNGFIVPVGDLSAMAESVRKLAGDPELRRRMGEESARLGEQLTVESTAAKYEAIFSNLARRR